MNPKKFSNSINGKAFPAFYSINIREVVAGIASSDVFIGVDKGIMHFASLLLTRTTGLFSVTDIEKHKSYNQGSLVVKMNEIEIHGLIVFVNNALYPNLNISA